MKQLTDLIWSDESISKTGSTADPAIIIIQCYEIESCCGGGESPIPFTILLCGVGL